MAKNKQSVEMIRKRMHGRSAFVAVEDEEKWTIALCYFGTSGWKPTILKYSTEEEADRIAANLNKELGLTRTEANVIIGDTMRLRPAGGDK